MALFQDRHGTFNIGAQPPISFKEMQKLGHRLCVPVPYALARGVHSALWRLTARSGEPAWLGSMRHSLIVDTRKAWDRLGWQARFSTQECIAKFFNNDFTAHHEQRR
jgi:nucleoside-diphosphate-sugar epimerase